MMKGTLDYLLRSTPTISLKITLAIVSLAISVFDTNMMVKCNVFLLLSYDPLQTSEILLLSICTGILETWEKNTV